MRPRTGSGGLAAAEYVGLVAVVAMVMGALLVLRPHDAGRRAPVRPLPAIIELIGAPVQPVVRPPRPPRKRRRRPPSEPHIVDVPGWLLGR